MSGQISFRASLLDDYVGEVNRLFDEMIDRLISVDRFVSYLKELNKAYLAEFAKDGYLSNGGAADAFEAAGKRAADFINSYADKFGEAMSADFNRDWRWRALLYPREGNRLAYVLGQQAAMSERGARSWQRRLHPELSRTGPCDLCIADSMLIPPIDEPFSMLHVGDVCDVIESIAYYVQTPEGVPPGEAPMVELPTPTRVTIPEVINMLRRAASSLGRIGQSIVRRVRRG